MSEERIIFNETWLHRFTTNLARLPPKEVCNGIRTLINNSAKLRQIQLHSSNLWHNFCIMIGSVFDRFAAVLVGPRFALFKKMRTLDDKYYFENTLVRLVYKANAVERAIELGFSTKTFIERARPSLNFGLMSESDGGPGLEFLRQMAARQPTRGVEPKSNSLATFSVDGLEFLISFALDNWFYSLAKACVSTLLVLPQEGAFRRALSMCPRIEPWFGNLPTSSESWKYRKLESSVAEVWRDSALAMAPTSLPVYILLQIVDDTIPRPLRRFMPKNQARVNFVQGAINSYKRIAEPESAPPPRQLTFHDSEERARERFLGPRPWLGKEDQVWSESEDGETTREPEEGGLEDDSEALVVTEISWDEEDDESSSSSSEEQDFKRRKR